MVHGAACSGVIGYPKRGPVSRPGGRRECYELDFFQMNAIDARRLAENSFKHVENPPDRQPAYEAEAITVRAKTARLKALRLAKEQSGVPGDSQRNTPAHS